MSIKCFCSVCVQLLVGVFIFSGRIYTQDLEYEIAPWYQWKKAATVLTYDDWSVDHPLIAIPELNKREMKGTFFVNGWAFEMLAQDIIQASSQGHEIGNHTETHPNLIDAGPSAFNKEIVLFQERLSEALPNDNCETFSYPFSAGAGDDLLSLQIQSILNNSHIGARAVIDQVFEYNFGGIDYYKLPALVVRSTTDVDKINSWNDEAIQKGGLAVIMYHKVDGSEGELTVTTDMYKAHLDAINQKRDQIWLATFKNMIKYHREANSASLSVIAKKDKVWELSLTDRLNDQTYNHPLSIKVKKPTDFQVNYIVQGDRLLTFSEEADDLFFEAIPDSGVIIISNELVTGARSEQNIIFEPIENKKTTDQPFDITATSSSGLPVNLEVTTGPAFIENGKVVLTGKSGTVNIKASQPGNISFKAAIDVVRTFVVEKVNQSIDFPSIANKKITDPSFSIEATASSGLPVTFELLQGPVRLEDNVITLEGDTGRVRIRASQPGNDSYRAALDVVQEFQISLLTQTIQMDPIPDVMLTEAPFIITASSSSTLPVSLEIMSGPATLRKDTCVLDGVGGIVTIRASQDGDDIYKPAEEVIQSFEVMRFNQEITFDPIEDKNVLDSSFTVNIESNAGLPVTLSVLEGPVTLAGDTVRLLRRSGQVELYAEQEGNETYAPAEPVTIRFFINKADQTITFEPIPNQILASDSVVLKASATSGLPVTFKLVSGPAFITDSVLFFTGFEGTVVVSAEQEGDSIYSAPTPVLQSFIVSKVLTVSNTPVVDPDVQQITIYPNPVTNIMNVEWKGYAYPIKAYSIYDVNGRTVASEQIHTRKTLITISVAEMPVGTYIIELADGLGRKYQKIFMVY